VRAINDCSVVTLNELPKTVVGAENGEVCWNCATLENEQKQKICKKEWTIVTCLANFVYHACLPLHSI